MLTQTMLTTYIYKYLEIFIGNDQLEKATDTLMEKWQDLYKQHIRSKSMIRDAGDASPHSDQKRCSDDNENAANR